MASRDPWGQWLRCDPSVLLSFLRVQLRTLSPDALGKGLTLKVPEVFMTLFQSPEPDPQVWGL